MLPFDALPQSRRAARQAFARAIRPDPERTVAEWADATRILGTEEGPFPGKWQTSRTPYLREPLEVASLSHPAAKLTLKFSAQTGKTQVPLNLLGQIATETPTSVLVVLPSIEEARTWNREKLDPMIANTPAIRSRVLEITSRDEKSSTTMNKIFAGGRIALVGANASKALQSRTVRVLICDEVSEFPFDVDGRGDPLAMAQARYTAFTGREKDVAVSTPGTLGSCRITKRYEESSRGVYHVPCPHCGHRQPLLFTQLRWTKGHPSTAAYYCAACGAAIQHHQKTGMIAAGAWVHGRPDLIYVHAGYHLSALYSPAVSWAWVVERYEASVQDPSLEKVFQQQVLGQAYEQRHDVVPHQALWERRTPYAAGRIPAGCLFLTGATDVQGDRLEWAVYAWDRHLTAWYVDGGMLMGDPMRKDVWEAHDALLERRYRDAWGRDWPCESWGIDSGYLSQRVYAYARRNAHRGSPRILALDGRAKWGEPPIGTPKAVEVDFAGRKIGSVQLWPVGTWDLKTEVTAALRLTEQGPDTDGMWPRGCMRFPDRLDIGFFEQLTAEVCQVRATRSGYEIREWIKLRARNEQLDLAVYTRALAHHDTLRFTEADWDRLAARRIGHAADLVTLMQSDLAAASAVPPMPPPAHPTTGPVMPPQLASPGQGDRAPPFIPTPKSGGWIRPSGGWL
ncbi:phage terminase large subunit family protein [Limobrevibacterium gyesilva]|uniref:Phage terminase large subunit family protein n=1 Tax=Limobrevibacterium gyesilva TaxID=2991712 RepID=A0AA41YVV5_9PROT|nr:phage terminase large subunit family protein [Limobrevibacterium gyesilva]MCW3477355.1 phage terminase large subunit family protein [Limobrevibacterium gyesilva]